MSKREDSIWKDRKRIFCGLPWTFTVYELTNDRLFIESGLLTTSYDEIRLYRILDVTLERNLIQKIFGLGTIKCCSSDSTMKDFCIKNIKNSKNVIEILSKQIESERDSHRIMTREIIDDTDHDY